MAEDEPGKHGDGLREPTEQLVPAGQATHWSAEVRFVPAECRPAGHGREAGEPSGQYPPASHSRGTTVARPQILPAGHSPEHRELVWWRERLEQRHWIIADTAGQHAICYGLRHL